MNTRTAAVSSDDTSVVADTPLQEWLRLALSRASEVAGPFLSYSAEWQGWQGSTILLSVVLPGQPTGEEQRALQASEFRKVMTNCLQETWPLIPVDPEPVPQFTLIITFKWPGSASS